MGENAYLALGITLSKNQGVPYSLARFFGN
jgi:hypothetical protein